MPATITASEVGVRVYVDEIDTVRSSSMKFFDNIEALRVVAHERSRHLVIRREATPVFKEGPDIGEVFDAILMGGESLNTVCGAIVFFGADEEINIK